MKIKFDFLPREEKFYRMLEDLAAKSYASTKLLNDLVELPDRESHMRVRQEISALKSESKKVFESITAEVCRTFITPFDREDIQAFATDMYKIVKIIEKISDRMTTHELRPAYEDFNKQAAIILREAEAMAHVIKELSSGRNTKNIYEKTAVLHELEDQGDVLLGKMIADLFYNVQDTRELILRKDIYEMFENVIDYYRDAANVALQIILKHS
jgi:uncharacterized protein Yka (UPF0111/DUF47 family)